MKRKDKMQINSQNKKELESQIQTVGAQIQKMRIDRYTKAAKNVREITNLKRKLAILKTVFNQVNEV